MSDQPLWSPPPERVRATRVMAFLGEANRRHQLSLAGYRDLHRDCRMVEAWRLLVTSTDRAASPCAFL